MEEETKQIKKDLVPYFIGLRNELKGISSQLNLLLKKELPEIQKVNVENQVEKTVVNFPEIQKAEVINQKEFPKEIEIKGFKSLLDAFYQSVGRPVAILIGNLEIWFKEWKNTILKVEVQNQIVLPTIQKVEVINQQEPPVVNVPDRVMIANSEPKDAVPVVLTTKDRKRFYEMIQQSFSVTDINLSGIKDLLTANTDIFIKTFDYDASNNLIFQGKAQAGSSKASAVWQIKKFFYDGNNNLIDIQFADGNANFDNIWNNRTSLSYS